LPVINPVKKQIMPTLAKIFMFTDNCDAQRDENKSTRLSFRSFANNQHSAYLNGTQYAEYKQNLSQSTKHNFSSQLSKKNSFCRH
jgi:hypothetical protein